MCICQLGNTDDEVAYSLRPRTGDMEEGSQIVGKCFEMESLRTLKGWQSVPREKYTITAFT